ncbi:hypothetical protein [Paenibacillus sp. NPDC058071]|uniref:hypothetical protein n=1 Tax=Paenibacillus sp. NPDC058071 TaxID=3346326 RepID=UPI0036DD2EC7
MTTDKRDKSDREHDDLVTEKDNDEWFGLFSDDPRANVVPDASDRLRHMYPRGSADRK